MTNGFTTKRSLLAVASMTSALLFFFPPAWAAALVLGVIALVEIKQSGGTLRGRGLAITGIVLSCIWSAALAIIVVRGMGNFFRNSSRAAWDASESEPAYEPDIAPESEEPAEKTPAAATPAPTTGSKPTPSAQPKSAPTAEPTTKKTPAQ